MHRRKSSAAELMPITRKYHLKDLMGRVPRLILCDLGKKLTFEYVLLKRRERYGSRRAARGEAGGQHQLQR